MKAIGIQIDADALVLVVLSKDANGAIIQTDESVRFNIADHTISAQVQQFRDQVNSTFDLITPAVIGIKMRNAKAKERGNVRPPSPISFKLEELFNCIPNAILILFGHRPFLHLKKNGEFPLSKNKYQQDAFDIAYYLLTK